MMPSNVDPRRPDKVQRYKSPASNGNASGEDLTPDYMNILGPDEKQNADKEEKQKQPEVQTVAAAAAEQQQQQPPASTNTTANVIPTSPQYGVAIISSETESATPATETVTDTTAKVGGEEKDMHTTPSRTNDRFKVVKIASLEPFKRGRWKCMDYVDEAPPPSTTQASKVPTAQMVGATMYLQTQSLPQQHIQQMLMQGGYPNAGVYPAGGVVPHTQYFYPQGQQIPNAGIPAQYISATQPYFPTVVPQSYQYVTPSAFVQAYAGQQQPLVNGHNFNNNEQQNGANLPTQPAKSVILNQQIPQQNQQYPVYQPNVVPLPQQNQGSQTVVSQPPLQNVTTTATNPVPMNVTQNLEPNSVYTNPQFVASVNSLPVLEGGGENSNEPSTSDAAGGDNSDDPAKTNPVVNAIDNKIEQAMDLVKSHLMYTVREEVEVLKEKIAELMERIQQLETENNFLRSQIPKNQQQQNQSQGGTPDPPPPAAPPAQ